MTRSHAQFPPTATARDRDLTAGLSSPTLAAGGAERSSSTSVGLTLQPIPAAPPATGGAAPCRRLGSPLLGRALVAAVLRSLRSPVGDLVWFLIWLLVSFVRVGCGLFKSAFGKGSLYTVSAIAAGNDERGYQLTAMCGGQGDSVSSRRIFLEKTVAAVVRVQQYFH